MKTPSYKFKRFAAGSICLVSIACGMLLTSCSTPTRTPKILDYATRTASEVQIKLADGNGLTMDLTEPNVLYNGVVSVQLKGKNFRRCSVIQRQLSTLMKTSSAMVFCEIQVGATSQSRFYQCGSE
ncbi:MAG: hypothetical protein IPL73_28570 [Candidatus Obscuribacter sp.]|nr:hypothetical protein [Candidatus Obscuribacter sp.]